MFLLIVLVFLVLLAVGMGVRVVSQGEELIVERLGKYHATLHLSPKRRGTRRSQ